MISIEVNNRKFPKLLFRISDIIFTQANKGFHFPHDDDLVIQLGIVNKLVKRILVNNGSSIDKIFKSTLRSMDWDLDNTQKLGIMNLVGFSDETSRVTRRMTLSVETHRITIYSKLMVIDYDLAYNVIIGRPQLHEMSRPLLISSQD